MKARRPARPRAPKTPDGLPKGQPLIKTLCEALFCDKAQTAATLARRLGLDLRRVTKSLWAKHDGKGRLDGDLVKTPSGWCLRSGPKANATAPVAAAPDEPRPRAEARTFVASGVYRGATMVRRPGSEDFRAVPSRTPEGLRPYAGAPAVSIGTQKVLRRRGSFGVVVAVETEKA